MIEDKFEDTININNILDEGYLTTINKIKIYKLSARDILPIIEEWPFNRPKNNDHINNIYQNINQIIGSFKLVKCLFNEGKLYLIDGQHRREAIIKKLLENSSFNIDIQVDILEVENEEEILEYFSLTNNVLKIQDFNLPKINYTKFINLLKNKFPKIFDDLKEFPYLNEKKILEELKKKEIFEKYNDLTPIMLFKKFDEKNNLLGLTNKDKYYQIRKEIGFFLNINWIDELMNDLSLKNNEIKITKIPKSKIIKNNFDKFLCKYKKYYIDNYEKYIFIETNEDNVFDIYFSDFLKKHTNNCLNDVFFIENRELYGKIDEKIFKYDEYNYFGENILITLKSILLKYDKKDLIKIEIDKILKPKSENLKKIKKIIKKYL